MRQIHRDMVSMLRTNFTGMPKSFWDKWEKKADARQLVEMTRSVYLKYYTLEDIKALNEFYKTPVGKKFLETTPQVMGECMANGQEWGRKLAEEITAELEKERAPQKPRISNQPFVWNPMDDFDQPKAPEWRSKARYRIDVGGVPRYFSEKEPKKSGGMFHFVDVRTGKEAKISIEGIAIVKLK